MLALTPLQGLGLFGSTVATLGILCLFFFFRTPAWANDRRMIVPPRPMLLDNENCLVMIRKLEKWNGWAEGRRGERGPFQFLRSTWSDYSAESFALARVDGPEGWYVARCHASFIRDEMEKHGLPQTAYTFALIWKAGIGHVLEYRTTAEDKDYAERGENVYLELIR